MSAAVSTRLSAGVALALACVTLAATDVAAQAERRAAPFAASAPASPAPAATRTVVYHPRDLVSLRARVHYTTLIVLPDGEQVIEATCGDRDRWIINVRDGLVSVKPTDTGIASNLNLVTTSGAVFAFLLSEDSGKADAASPADLTLYIERDETALSPASLATATPRRKFVAAEELEAYREQATVAREQAERATSQARADADAAITAYRTTYPLTMHFAYRVDTRKAPFRIRAMWHDDHRTFIQTTARELPALYEYQDRRPALVNFEVHDTTTYVVPKVIRDGYLQLGATRLGFRLQEEQ
jgi:type IV secretory pathway VirB9-like protein